MKGTETARMAVAGALFDFREFGSITSQIRIKQNVYPLWGQVRSTIFRNRQKEVLKWSTKQFSTRSRVG